MTLSRDFDPAHIAAPAPFVGVDGHDGVYPQAFAAGQGPGPESVYLADPSVRKLVEFFDAKGLAALKDEDRREHWYDDWLAYQAEHGIYASVLSPREYSTRGHQLDLLRLVRLIEVFGYCSPAHGYSLQVSFLGLFVILMGSNDALKREAVAVLEAGSVLAFGVSEKHHGADLLANEFLLTEVADGRYVANGSKYYIGNANSATIVSILARKVAGSGGQRVDKRAPFALFALRPKQSPGFGMLRKIRTLGVRAAYVGEFSVKDHELPASDVIADGRLAWDAFFGTVTMGKFLLGFGSIGICEHALTEAVAHMGGRTLFGKPAIQMPHLGAATAQAYARLTAMKLFAYRALDYLHAASATDRRYLLFNAIQKAKVSTEGLKVMSLLVECVGARGLEAETYIEMALRDAQLIPAVEGSTHVNLGQAAQFLPRYFAKDAADLPIPPSLLAGETASRENPYLMEARTGAIGSIAFPHFLDAYRPLWDVPNVRIFARQTKAFQRFASAIRSKRVELAETEVPLAMGQCLATIAYGQLIAENALRLKVPSELVAVIFHLLIGDLSATALTLAASPRLEAVPRLLQRRIVSVPSTTAEAWDFVMQRAKDVGVSHVVGRPISTRNL